MSPEILASEMKPQASQASLQGRARSFLTGRSPVNARGSTTDETAGFAGGSTLQSQVILDGTFSCHHEGEHHSDLMSPGILASEMIPQASQVGPHGRARSFLMGGSPVNAKSSAAHADFLR